MSAVTTGRTGIGVLLRIGDGEVSETFAAMANITSMDVGGKTLAFEDATHLDSPDLYAEFLPTLKSADEWTLNLQWDPDHATQDATTGIESLFEARTKRNFQVDPSAIGLTSGFQALCYTSNIGNVSITPTGIMTRSITLKPTGKVTSADFS